MYSRLKSSAQCQFLCLNGMLVQRLAAEIPGYQVPNILIYNYETPEHNLSSSQVPQVCILIFSYLYSFYLSA